MNLDGKVLAFACGLISAAFGAGVTFTLWQASHPTDVEIATALGCSAYGGRLSDCPAARDAKEARRESLAQLNELRRLRRDLARGFGRALANSPADRERAGKAALWLYQRELQSGAAPEEAMLKVLESDF